MNICLSIQYIPYSHANVIYETVFSNLLTHKHLEVHN